MNRAQHDRDSAQTRPRRELIPLPLVNLVCVFIIVFTDPCVAEWFMHRMKSIQSRYCEEYGCMCCQKNVRRRGTVDDGRLVALDGLAAAAALVSVLGLLVRLDGDVWEAPP